MAHKFFTLAEANRTLPLVKRVVQDILTVYPQWKDLVAQYELIAARARAEWSDPVRALLPHRDRADLAHGDAGIRHPWRHRGDRDRDAGSRAAGQARSRPPR